MIADLAVRVVVMGVVVMPVVMIIVFMRMIMGALTMVMMLMPGMGYRKLRRARSTPPAPEADKLTR